MAQDMSENPSSKQPLRGCRVLDFSTLLPGPLATQMLAAAGAEVIKIERPEGGDELRAGTPQWADTSLGFALLNGGKRSIALDLKQPAERARLLPLLSTADIVVEQFRPGVMDRLGLGYETLKALNPALIYCAITGYGQAGPLSQVAGHDLTYMADTGLLSLAQGVDGAPTLPPVLVADIGAGTLPAVINILLALRQRDISGEGCRIDVSITDNLFAFPYAALPRGEGLGDWPRAGQERLTGGSPRYQLYRTRDGRHVAAAPLEQRFWIVFCETINLPADWRDDRKDPQGTRAAVAECIARHDSSHWRAAFDGKDACAVVVNTMQEAAAHPHFRGRGPTARTMTDGDRTAPVLRLPLDPQFLNDAPCGAAPSLGEATALLVDAVAAGRR